MSAAEARGRPGDREARRDYWEGVHEGRPEDGVSWWQSVPGLSLALVDATGLAPEQPVIDVGAGWSTLADHLLERGFTDVTAIDLSRTALDTVRHRVDGRMGEVGRRLTLDVADVLGFDPGRRYALWHDRAVYHFLTEPDERKAYRASLERCIAPGGWVAMATFGPEGPTTCSGLPVVRYTHEQLAAELPGYTLVDSAGEGHRTPWGTTQQFTAVLLRAPGA